MIRRFLPLIYSFGIVFIVAFLGSAITIPALDDWYTNLAKPAFNPPSFVFGPAWTILYILMAISAYLVWTKGKGAKLNIALAYYAGQLILNFLWSYLFFGLKNPLIAFLDIVILWILILFTTLKFWQISKPAGILLIPYLLWVTFAAFLNFSILILN